MRWQGYIWLNKMGSVLVKISFASQKNQLEKKGREGKGRKHEK